METQLKSHIYSIFPTDQFTVTFSKLLSSMIFVEDKNGQNCVKFYLEYKNGNVTIHIENLDKCNANTGTQLLSKMEELTRLVGIDTLQLDDESNIIIERCDDLKISLYTLYVLTTGQNWYNSKGYISTNQREIDAQNQELINLNIIDFMNMCKEAKIQTYAKFLEMMEPSINIPAKLEKEQTKNNSILINLLQYLPDLNDSMTVKVFFNPLNEYL